MNLKPLQHLKHDDELATKWKRFEAGRSSNSIRRNLALFATHPLHVCPSNGLPLFVPNAIWNCCFWIACVIADKLFNQSKKEFAWIARALNAVVFTSQWRHTIRNVWTFSRCCFSSTSLRKNHVESRAHKRKSVEGRNDLIGSERDKAPRKHFSFYPFIWRVIII